MHNSSVYSMGANFKVCQAECNITSPPKHNPWALNQKHYTLNTKKEHHKLAFWSMVENHFENNTIRCKKLTTIVSGRKNVPQPWVRQKQVSTSAEMIGTCAYLFSPDEGSCYIFSTWNNCCEFLASYGVTLVIFNHTSY